MLLVSLHHTHQQLAYNSDIEFETSGDLHYDYYDTATNQQFAVDAVQLNAGVKNATKAALSAAKDSANAEDFKLEDYYDYSDYDDANYNARDYDNYNDDVHSQHEFIGEPSDHEYKNPEETYLQTSTYEPKTTQKSSRSKLLAIMAKPGILAGIVGGAIIGVLTAGLLIMFIVYRMKKKDEGSYALEETKKPLNAYDYRHCPTKEFYA